MHWRIQGTLGVRLGRENGLVVAPRENNGGFRRCFVGRTNPTVEIPQPLGCARTKVVELLPQPSPAASTGPERVRQAERSAVGQGVVRGLWLVCPHACGPRSLCDAVPAVYLSWGGPSVFARRQPRRDCSRLTRRSGRNSRVHGNGLAGFTMISDGVSRWGGGGVVPSAGHGAASGLPL